MRLVELAPGHEIPVSDEVTHVEQGLHLVHSDPDRDSPALGGKQVERLPVHVEIVGDALVNRAVLHVDDDLLLHPVPPEA
jgi:hypothetical protein